MDWAFVNDNERAPPTCYKMDAELLEGCDELDDLRMQCESFIMGQSSRAVHSESVCRLGRDAIRAWVKAWKRPLISEVCWTSTGLVCKVSATVPHWEDAGKCVFITLSHNGSWCVCREMAKNPEIRKCVKDVTKKGVYLSTWNVSQRELGKACSKHAVHFNSEFSWKLVVIE